ncbi:hypothetical protein CKO44_08030 [Rubrivivax gelatinosus]|uniref:ATP-binding protein n=1 Tax=Rubrivivax gelatinosus TaxID=28068 RepID=UPI0019060158|nr:sensor histidine kinase [Rubrivivax gelatinosus]MBK1613417.1 hypothetical protein [Rubrivivax gelatinosus]
MAPKPDRFGLAARLIALGVLSALLAGVAASLVLQRSLQDVVLRSVEQGLLQRAERVAAELRAAQERGRPLGGVAAGAEFETIFSGWYWQLGEDAGAPRSRSLWDGGISADPAQARPPLARAQGPRGEPLWGLATALELAGEAPRTLQVWAPAAESDAEIERIRRVLLALPLGLTALLGGLAVLQARVGLAPVRRLQAALGRVRAGDAGQLGEDFGPDLAPLAREMDAVLQRNAQIVERSRHHAADLGHALKKPLALLSAAAQAPAVDAGAVQQQLHSMAALIDRHLVRSASGAGGAGRIEVAPVLDGVLALVRHLHAARALEWDVELEPGLRWAGAAGDLEEMAGNLLDNAGKWAAARVRVRCARDGERIVLTVEDDGPGLSAGQIAEAGQRGRRFDESVAGSGLGLAIVDDLAATYGGTLALEAGALGGLRCRLAL